MLFEINTAVKPTLTGVKIPASGTLTCGGAAVGRMKGVSVLVGVKRSAPSAVTVGVKVSGVLVEVAKKFCVGIGVTVGMGVKVGEGRGVAVAASCERFGRAEQPGTSIARRRMGKNFFMETPSRFSGASPVRD